MRVSQQFVPKERESDERPQGKISTECGTMRKIRNPSLDQKKDRSGGQRRGHNTLVVRKTSRLWRDLGELGRVQQGLVRLELVQLELERRRSQLAVLNWNDRSRGWGD